MSSTKVPVGVSTLAGYSTSVVTLAGAVAAFLTGDRSRDTLVIVLLGGYSGVSFVVTQVGRYVQAREQVKKPAPVTSPLAWKEVPPLPAELFPEPPDPEDTPDPNPPVSPDPKAANDDLDRVTS